MAKWLADRRNVAVIDADAAGRQVLEQPSIQAALRREFGSRVFDREGRVDRSAVARMVFGNAPQQVAARRKLEEIVHPGIQRAISETLEAVRASNGVEAVVLDAAVLLEAGWQNVCQAVVFVDAPLSRRRERVAEGRNWTSEELQRREASQMDLAEKRRRADFVIENDSTIDDAGQQLEQVLNRLLQSGV